MKKTGKIVSLSLCATLVLGVAATGIGAYIRGGIDKYDLPEGFEEAIRQVDSSREDGNIRIMSANLLVHYKSWGGEDARPRAKMFTEVLSAYKPDVVGLQELSGQWYNCLMRNGGSYKLLYPVTTGVCSRLTALAYNTDTLNVIDKGDLKYKGGTDARLRRAVWGIFENKETKEQFAVVSTHFDLMRSGQEEEMRAAMESQVAQITALSNTLKETYQVPVFCIGDFNAMNAGGETGSEMEAPAIYDKLSSLLQDTKDIAEEKVGGDAAAPDAPTWDHIFLNGEATVSKFAVVSPALFEQMSDHYPIFADVQLKK